MMSIKNLDFLCDVDGVLGDFVGHSLNLLSKDFSILPKKEDIVSWNMEDYFLPTVKKQFFRILASHKFWETMPVIPGAVDFLIEVDKVANVIFLTSPWRSCDKWEKTRFLWLKQNFPFKFAYIPTSDKEYVDGHIFLDDKEDNLIKWKEKRPNKKAILFAAPYNTSSGGLIRLGWSEKEELLKIVKTEVKSLVKSAT